MINWLRRVLKKITILKTQSKEKSFKNLVPQDDYKLKQVTVKQSLLTNAQVFEKSGIERVKKDKRCRILCELVFVKKSPRQPPFMKANIWKGQNLAKKYMKIDLSKVIFTDKSQVTFHGPDSRFHPIQMCLWLKEGNKEVLMWWTRIVDQAIIEPFQVDKGVKLSSANYFNFMDKSFAWYKSQSCSFKVKCVFMRDNAPSLVLKLTCEFFELRYVLERRMATIKFRSEFIWNSMVNCEDEILWR